MDTIFALASAQGKAGVSVIRISGDRALEAGAAMAGALPEHGRSLRKLRDAQGDLIDETLVLTFAKGHSFTGEAVVELHVHGSRAVVAAVLAALGQQPGLRMAEAGEFTRRAFDSGRLDLGQVEGLADLIEAETEAQRRLALRQMDGDLRALADRCRDRLIRAAALIEATIDFVDEDVPVDVTPEVLALIDAVLPELAFQVSGFGAAERVREGFEVVILGPPNAGKSTLLNAIAGREAAITSAIPGTTRDLIEIRVDLGGLAVTFVDTAGLRDTEDEVEGMGVDRALARAATADLRVFLSDGVGHDDLGLKAGPEDIRLTGKADLGPGVGGTGPGDLSISGKTGAGVADFLDLVRRRLADRASGAGVINRDRHLAAVKAAIGALESARNQVIAGPHLSELAAEDLRSAMRSLDRLIGRVDVDAVLDEIFSSFCIGK